MRAHTPSRSGAVQEISPQNLQQLMTTASPVILDVREDWEFAQAHLPGSVHIPMGQIPARYAELDASRQVVVVCHYGTRSLQVVQFLEKKGFATVSNLAGGLDAWAEQVDPAMPRY